MKSSHYHKTDTKMKLKPSQDIKKDSNEVTILPIKLPDDQDICVQFQIETFIASFGDAARFLEGKPPYMTPDKYLVWLEERLQADPDSAVHLWQNGRIIGQIEMGAYVHDPHYGYVYVIYLVPEARGAGITRKIDQYIVDYCAKKNFLGVRASISPTNKPVHGYVRQFGWIKLGPDPDEADAIFVGKEINSKH